jgi:GH24 family phage-related lysozyme (muramidase)
MITKKLGEEIFAWNDDAFSGKGYWFVLGKKGGFGRAASKEEVKSLGKPSDNTPKQSFSALKKQKDEVEKQLKAFEEKGSVVPSEKNKSKKKTPLSDLTEKNKPLNLNSSDSLRLKFTGSTPEPVKKGDSIADSLGKVFTLIKTKNEYNKTNKELHNNFKEEEENKEQKRHEEIISAITGGKKPSGVDAIDENKVAKKPISPPKIQKPKEKKPKQKKPSLLKKVTKKVAKKVVGPAAIVAGGLFFKKETTEPEIEQAAPGKGVTPTATPQAKEKQDTSPSKVEQAVPGKQKETAEKVKPPQTSDDNKKMIIRHEGAVPYPYKDSKGLWTIGVGHLIGDGKSLPPEYDEWKNNGAANAKGNNTKPALTQEQMNKLFDQDYAKHEKLAEKGPGFDKANEPAKGAFVDLTFNMGAWWTKFKNAGKAASSGDWSTAAEELKDSLWHKQVGKRADEVIGLVKHAGDGETTGVKEGPKMAAVPAASPVKMAELTGSGVKEGQHPEITDTTRKAAAGSLDSVVAKQNGVDLKPLNGSLAERVAAMASDFKEKTGKKLLVTSAFRSNEKQKQLWDAELAKNGGNVALTRKTVAEPAAPYGNGKGSLHASGLAIDINSKGESGLNELAGPRNRPTGWLESFGLTRPVNGEDWHVQVAGTPATPDNPVKPGAPVLVTGKGDTATDVSTGQNKPIPKEKETATSVASTPKSSNLASASTQNKDLKDKQSTPTSSSPVVVNNTKIVNHGTTNNIVAENDPKNDKSPGFLG